MIHENFTNAAISESPDLASVVAVIRPSERPMVLPHGNLIEFQSTDVVNSKRQSFEIFILNALNGFAKKSVPTGGLSVTSSSYLDPAASVGFPLFTAINLKGEAASEHQVARFREAVVVLANEVLGQASLFHAGLEQESSLSDHELDSLKEEAFNFRSKQGGQTIKSGFHIHCSLEDREGIAISGKLPPLQHAAPINEEIEGVAMPDGFCMSQSFVSLVPLSDGDSSAKSMHFLCSHQAFFKTIAEACMCGCRVRYRGYRLTHAGAKKVILNLTGLELVAANDPDDGFDLE